ncbi:hypothetical protein [Rhodovibrio salinarum]|uniref:hypothetical protein n=1 Tax=Rhodovibrio salinarum TaxID=1087 RepID=UPI0004B26E19|nr:hypothetical protein [Rhodovibrio salinarum]
MEPIVFLLVIAEASKNEDAHANGSIHTVELGLAKVRMLAVKDGRAGDRSAAAHSIG